jgi:hypothetical protein
MEFSVSQQVDENDGPGERACSPGSTSGPGFDSPWERISQDLTAFVLSVVGDVPVDSETPVVYLSILSPARAAHEPYWAGVGRVLEACENFFWPEGPTRKLRSDASNGMVIGRIFSARNNRIFFNPARPEKCSGLPVVTSSILRIYRHDLRRCS